MPDQKNKTTHNQENINSKLNTINEVCVLLRSGRSKIYKLIISGELKAKKLGNRTFVTAESINEFIECLPSYQAEPALKKRQQKTAA